MEILQYNEGFSCHEKSESEESIQYKFLVQNPSWSSSIKMTLEKQTKSRKSSDQLTVMLANCWLTLHKKCRRVSKNGLSHQARCVCREDRSAEGVARDPHNLCGIHGGTVTPSNTKTHAKRVWKNNNSTEQKHANVPRMCHLVVVVLLQTNCTTVRLHRWSLCWVTSHFGLPVYPRLQCW